LIIMGLIQERRDSIVSSVLMINSLEGKSKRGKIPGSLRKKKSKIEVVFSKQSCDFSRERFKGIDKYATLTVESFIL
ncbi:hypothetical protein CHH71_20900, partial [Shouchella clausii]